jgi:hypothetical protein
VPHEVLNTGSAAFQNALCELQLLVHGFQLLPVATSVNPVACGNKCVFIQTLVAASVV